jgi:predicted O-methyltransferase YrrM
MTKSKRWQTEAPTAQVSSVDLAYLTSLASGAHWGIEIGCLCGGTTRWLSDHMLPGSVLYAIDPWSRGWRQWHRQFRAHLAAYLADGRVVEVRHRSSKAFPYLLEHLGATLDFVFIDGDHSYEAVRADIANYRQLVRPGGVLCGHDYGDVCPGVRRAVDEAFAGSHTLVEWIWWVRVPE